MLKGFVDGMFEQRPGWGGGRRREDNILHFHFESWQFCCFNFTFKTPDLSEVWQCALQRISADCLLIDKSLLHGKLFAFGFFPPFPTVLSHHWSSGQFYWTNNPEQSLSIELLFWKTLSHNEKFNTHETKAAVSMKQMCVKCVLAGKSLGNEQLKLKIWWPFYITIWKYLLNLIFLLIMSLNYSCRAKSSSA